MTFDPLVTVYRCDGIWLQNGRGMRFVGTGDREVSRQDVARTGRRAVRACLGPRPFPVVHVTSHAASLPDSAPVPYHSVWPVTRARARAFW